MPVRNDTYFRRVKRPPAAGWKPSPAADCVVWRSGERVVAVDVGGVRVWDEREHTDAGGVLAESNYSKQ